MFNARSALIFMATTQLVIGIVEPFTANPGAYQSPLGIAQVMLLSVLSYNWCRLHAVERGIPPPAGSAIFVAVFPLIGVPVYFARTLPWRKAVLESLKALGLLVGILVLYALGYAMGGALHA